MSPSQVWIDIDAQDGQGHFPAFGYTYMYPTSVVTDSTDGITITQVPEAQQYSGSMVSYQVYATDNANMSPSGWAWTLDFSKNPFVPGAPAAITFFAPAGPCSFSVSNASPAVVTWTPTAAFSQAFTNNTLPNGTQVQLTTLTGGSGLTQGSTYYVINSGNGTFQLSSTLNGAAINTTATGTGTFTVTRYRYSGLVPAGSNVTFSIYATSAALAAEISNRQGATAALVPLSNLSVAPDGQGNAGLLLIANPAINSMAANNQASGILSGGTTGSPMTIAGVVNYSLMDGGYDDVIETTSVGVLRNGGAHNRIFGNSASHSGIIWGSFHVLKDGSYAVIGGGTQNTLNADYAVIAGGNANTIPSGGLEAVISGGNANIASGQFSFIGSGSGNVATGNGAVTAGGGGNYNFGLDGTLGGGNGNQVGDGKVVTDGAISASGTTLTCATSTPFASPIVVGSTVIVLGAGPNPTHTTTGGAAARGVPLVTTISSITDTGHAVLAAAATNTVSGATVILISGDTFASYATIGGGFQNIVGKTATSQYATIAGGRNNEVEAQYGHIPGGQNNTVTAAYGMAAGTQALADHVGAMVHSPGKFSTQGDNQMEFVHMWRSVVNTTTATELLLDGVGTRLILTANNTAYAYQGLVLAKQPGTATVNAYQISGVIAMGVGGGTLVLKAHTETQLTADVATGSIAVTADTAHSALVIKWTDTAGGAVTWNVCADIQIRKISG